MEAINIKLFRKRTEHWTSSLLYGMLLIYIGISPSWSILNILGYVPFINMAYIISLGLIIFLCYRIVAMLRTNSKITIPSSAYLVGLLVIIYVLLIQIVSFPFLAEMGTEEVILYRNRFVSTGIMSLMFFLVGVDIVYIGKLIQQTIWRQITILVSVSYFVIITLAIIIPSGKMPDNIFSFALNMHMFSNYLHLADSLAILSIILICLIIRNTSIRWIVFAITLVFLYATLSRSAFYLYSVAILAFLIISSLNKKTSFILIVAVFILGSVGFNDAINEHSGRRIFKLAYDLSSDTSYIARKQLLKLGLEDLKNNWILGMFMAEMKAGRYGGYIHNYLSFWIAYGVVPFIGFVYSAILGFATLFSELLKNRKDPLIGFVATYSIYCFLAIILSKYYGWPFVWMAISAAPQVVKHYKCLVQ